MEKVIKINNDNLVTLKSKRSDHPKYLNDLISSLQTCAENYKKLASESDLPELKDISTKLAAERAEFVHILKDGFREKGRKNYNTLKNVKPLWFKLVKSVAHSKGDQILVSTILKNELGAAKKYNTYLYNHIPTVEQLNILLEQQKAINEAIELFRSGYNLHAQGISMLAPEVA